MSVAATPSPPVEITVLLVDDEPDLLELLSYSLERENFRVLVAKDGVEGLELAQKEKPDVIVLDIMMPKLDGLELGALLREDAQLRLTPILMLTARTGERNEIAGLDAGADDYLPKPISPRLFVSRMKALLRREERTESASTPNLRAHDLVIDRERIRQVVANLMENAIRYNEPGGRVEVIVRSKPDDKIHVSVVDDGIGISPESIPRLTDRFFRVDKSRSREQGGTGLGLAIVKHILEALGERLEIESRADYGSKFAFKLPVDYEPQNS